MKRYMLFFPFFKCAMLDYIQAKHKRVYFQSMFHILIRDILIHVYTWLILGSIQKSLSIFGLYLYSRYD